MKNLLKIGAVLGLSVVATTATAQDVARVVKTQPTYETIYERVCRQVTVQTDNKDEGTVIGAITGGIVGNQVGNGSGKDVATILGAIIGANVGNRIGSDQKNTVTQEQCENRPVQRQVGEVITFEYKGKRFSVQF